MARSYHSLLCNIRRTVIHHSALERDGKAQFLRYDPLPSADGETKSFIHVIPVLPSAGYFKVELYPPTDLEEGDVPMRRGPVKLVYHLKDLYLIGFEFNQLWYVFKDADLVGISNEVQLRYVRRLRFEGNYSEIAQNYNRLVIGFSGQCDTWTQLTDFNPDGDDSLVIRALCRNVVTVSEASRFPFLAKHITIIFSLFRCDGRLDSLETGNCKNFSEHFNDWGAYCKAIRKGRVGFASINGITTYEDLLTFVGILTKITDDSPTEKVVRHKAKEDDDVMKGRDKQKENRCDNTENNTSAKGPFWCHEAPIREYSHRRCATHEHLACMLKHIEKDAFHLRVHAKLWSASGEVQETSAGRKLSNLIRRDGLEAYHMLCNNYHSKSARKDAFNLRVQDHQFYGLFINNINFKWLGAFGKAQQICPQLDIPQVLLSKRCNPHNAISAAEFKVSLLDKHEDAVTTVDEFGQRLFTN